MPKGVADFATSDCHLPNHSFFEEQDGSYPAHCVMDTVGVEFAPVLHLPTTISVIAKPAWKDQKTYSAFGGTDLEGTLHGTDVRRLSIGGLPTEYGVFNTVKDALRRGFYVPLLVDAIRPINLKEGAKAEVEMI